MRTVTYTCICGISKQVSNHWVIAFLYGRYFTFHAWEDKVADLDGALHLCGEGCATKLLSQQVASWKELA